MANSIVAGFLKGLTGNAVDQIDARRKAEQEMAKAKMLEQLRVETEKEMTLFKESRPDYQEELRGRKITNDYNTEKMRQDQELFPLDLAGKKQALEYAAEDQRMQRESHADSLRTNAESRAASRASRAKSLDGGSREGGTMSNDVYREYNRTFTELADAGANPAELANYQTIFADRVTSGRWNKAQQMKFLTATRTNFTQGGTYTTGPNKGKKFAPRLEAGIAANSLLDAKLKK